MATFEGILLLTKFHAYLRLLFVTVHNSLCIPIYWQVCIGFSEIVYFVGIILRTTDVFKRISGKNNCKI